MMSFRARNPSKVREGVELWELGESLGGVVGVSNLAPICSALRIPSSCSSDTSSLGSSGSSSSSGAKWRLWNSLSDPIRVIQNPFSWHKEEGENIINEDGMSLREREPYLGPIPQGLTRSHSFGGLLMAPGGRRGLSGSTSRTGWSGMNVLGQGFPTSPSDLRKSNSLPPHVKVPKTPRSQRTTIIAGAASKGVKECISVTRNDMEALSKAQFDYKMAKSQGRVYEMEKQMKAAERYLKRLEFLLSQIEDLHDQYSLTQRLREGVHAKSYY